MSDDATVISKLNEIYSLQKYTFELVQLNPEEKVIEKEEIIEEKPVLNIQDKV
jgi:hypothetical protein